jgi:hypothetical protein
MAKRKDRGRNAPVGGKRGERPARPRDIVGELLDIDDLKKVLGGNPGCKECIICHSDS